MDPLQDIWTQAVIEQNRRWLLAYLRAATGDAALSEDLVQEVFVIAYQKRHEYRKGNPFGAWLRGIARNLVRRAAEDRSRRPTLISTDAAWEVLDRCAAHLEDSHMRPGYEAARQSALRRCVEKLTNKARALIEGRYRRGLSLPRLAGECGLSTRYVAVALFRARAALVSCVKKNTYIVEEPS
ncbi:MAG: sigma-70 family RNA polymerase sigma factor [Planctomycetes bacterium]|nr:sigma-70 family RNA polymerase sigma factor [Planctomycetota bacterium]